MIFFLQDPSFKVILNIILWILGFFISYVLFYKSLRNKYSKKWTIFNVLVWGSILSFVFQVVYVLLLSIFL